MPQTPKNFIRKMLGSKVFLFFISLAFIFLFVNVLQESYRKYQLAKEVKRLQAEIEKVEGKNQQLAGLMEYFEDESYLEQQARLKLNLKKPGEQVVIISDSSENSGPISFEVEKQNEQLSETANYWKWWEYFFSD